MSDVTRVEFDATLEEIVDVDMRLVMRQRHVDVVVGSRNGSSA